MASTSHTPPDSSFTSVLTDADYEAFAAARVNVFGQSVKEQLADPETRGLPADVIIKTALDALQASRASNISRKLLKASRIPNQQATIAEVYYLEGRNLKKEVLAKLADTDWVTDPTWLTITAPTGGGKSYLASALGVAACHNRIATSYWQFGELDLKLQELRADTIAYTRFINQLKEVKLLIIDDFFTVPVSTDTCRQFFGILATRENRKATIIATQTGPQHWYGQIPEPVVADSIVNRIAHCSRELTLGDVDVRRFLADDRGLNAPIN